MEKRAREDEAAGTPRTLAPITTAFDLARQKILKKKFSSRQNNAYSIPILTEALMDMQSFESGYWSHSRYMTMKYLDEVISHHGAVSVLDKLNSDLVS